MELEQVKGNTWVLKSWELIPFYKLDDSHCILLDTGLNDQREDLEGSLREAGLTPVGVICSHAHIDHMAMWPISNRPTAPSWPCPWGRRGTRCPTWA